MHRFREQFEHRHVVLPVIHVEHRDQARCNAEIAIEAGADGVFLINHHLSCAELLKTLVEAVREA